MNKLRHKQELIGFLGFFYAIPIALLYFRFIPFESYYAILILMGLILAAYSIQQGISAKSLGFETKNFWPALFYALMVSLVGIVLVLIGSKLNIYHKVTPVGNIWFYLFYLFISAPLQEFIFRGLMLYELQVFFKSETMLVLTSAVLFSLAHIFFHNFGVLAATFVAGLIWGWIFVHRPNIYAVWISHAVLGAVAVLFRFI